ncbi:hypothetical protein HDV06_000288 [Boothiomyces sp. JEL0866]|nr:hypothetical protein HDV06_000288 [Boothiomyces sp. JEL0866]
MNIFRYAKALTIGDLYREKDPKIAFENYLIAAELGSTLAMQNISFYYKTGQGVEKDLVKSFEWMQKAAELERIECMNGLGVKYKQGEGTDINLELALEWYQKAAAKGSSEALYNLGKFYSEEGPNRNLKLAVEYYIKSKMGIAYNNIAAFYYNGDLEKNFGKALHWFKKADGAVYSRYYIAIILLKPDYLDVAQAIEYLSNWKNALAYNLLGIIYSSSKYNTKDIKRAIDYFKLAANCKVNLSRQQLAAIYRNKEYFEEPDEYKAQMYEKLALDAGFYKFRYNHSILNIDEINSHPDETCSSISEKAKEGIPEYQNLMGILYLKGYFDAHPISHGDWFIKAAENGDLDAMYNLKIHECALASPSTLKYLDYFQQTDFPETNYIMGKYYLDGKYVEKDLERAVRYFEKSVLGGFAYAAFTLYECFKNGIGVEKDEEKSIYYLKEAAQEVVEAQYLYGSQCDDKSEASVWLSLAAINQHPKAKDLLEKIVNSN